MENTQKISQDFTKLIQEELVKKKLVNTGKLLRSIKVDIIKKESGYEIELTSEDYFWYLNDKFNILEDIYNSSKWNIIEEQLAELNVGFIETGLDEELNNN